MRLKEETELNVKAQLEQVNASVEQLTTAEVRVCSFCFVLNKSCAVRFLADFTTELFISVFVKKSRRCKISQSTSPSHSSVTHGGGRGGTHLRFVMP